MVEWLERFLAGGPRLASEVRVDAQRAGFSYATLRRAFADLNGKSTPLGSGVPTLWMWALPDEVRPT